MKLFFVFFSNASTFDEVRGTQKIPNRQTIQEIFLIYVNKIYFIAGRTAASLLLESLTPLLKRLSFSVK